jgi:hypothetical protein
VPGTGLDLIRISAQAKVVDAVSDRLEAQKNHQFYQNKLKVEQKGVAEIEGIANTLQEEFTTWTERAEEFCPRVENPRKVVEVQRLLTSVEAALEERERR